MSRGTVRRRSALLAILAAAALTVGSSRPDAVLTDSPDYAATCLAVGASVNAVGGSHVGTLSHFLDAQDDIGPLTIRRSFDSSLPNDFGTSAAAGDRAAGVHSFVSWKPPHGDFRGAAEGRYDRQVRAWAESAPAGTYATSFHEPENDMSGPEFVALQRHLYVVVKDANPTIHWGPVYMAYWWDPAEPSHYIGDVSRWWVGTEYADFVGLDWYGPDPEPMTRSDRFLHWYRAMHPTGLPLFITEYGQYVVDTGEKRDPAKERARIEALHADAEWIADHPQISMWIYWQRADGLGDWRLSDEGAQRAWRTIARQGCPS